MPSRTRTKFPSTQVEDQWTVSDMHDFRLSLTPISAQAMHRFLQPLQTRLPIAQRDNSQIVSV